MIFVLEVLRRRAKVFLTDYLLPCEVKILFKKTNEEHQT